MEDRKNSTPEILSAKDFANMRLNVSKLTVSRGEQYTAKTISSNTFLYEGSISLYALATILGSF